MKQVCDWLYDADMLLLSLILAGGFAARALRNLEKLLMAKLDELSANVAATVTAEQSAIVLLGNLKSSLDAAIAAEDDGAALAALSDSLATNQAALAAAVVANTPSKAIFGMVAPDSATSSAHPAVAAANAAAAASATPDASGTPPQS